MARCPHCNYKLQVIDVKAECPVCGVNIPNYNWEGRLEEDAVNAERSFAKFRKKTGAFKDSLFGNKFRIARVVFTFVPLVFFLFPMFTMELKLPFTDGTMNMSMLNIILGIVNGKIDIGAMFGYMSFDRSGTAFTMLIVSMALVILGIVAAVLNFAIVIIAGFGYHAKGNIVCCVASIVFFVAAVVTVIVTSSMFASSIPEIAVLKLSYGLFIGIALFAVNLIINFIARKQFADEKLRVLKQEQETAAEKEKETAVA